MLVKNLEGAELDYWVARAEGLEHPPYLGEMRPGRCMMPLDSHDHDGPIRHWVNYDPSENWNLAGPIIERENIGFDWEADDICIAWYQRSKYERAGSNQFSGSTPLKAAMRAFVASQYGEEVPEQPQVAK